jgi:hypothetical protein
LADITLLALHILELAEAELAVSVTTQVVAVKVVEADLVERALLAEQKLPTALVAAEVAVSLELYKEVLAALTALVVVVVTSMTADQLDKAELVVLQAAVLVELETERIQLHLVQLAL